MLKRVNESGGNSPAGIEISKAAFPMPYPSGLEYASPARGTWNIVHAGMLIPEAHEIFVCAASCLRGVVLTAAEMGAQERFSTIEVKEQNLLDGDLEELVIEGVTDLLQKFPKKPPAILLYTSCVHHFAGCDLGRIYKELRQRFPETDFTDCYMNPIMRKSGLTPDQLMRSRLYMLLKERSKKAHTAAIIGNHLPTREESELVEILRENGFGIHEITSCKTYEEYQQMAESDVYISYNPAAIAGGEMLQERLGGQHIYLPLSFCTEEIMAGFEKLAARLELRLPDFKEKKEACKKKLQETLQVIGEIPICIDYTYCSRPLSLARMLLDAGFCVKRVYVDAITGEEKEDFSYLQEHFPQLLLYPTVHSGMRFMKGNSNEKVLAIGQKAAHFERTNYFVNVVEGGGMLGFDAILHTLELMEEACSEEKDMRNLIQMKGMGCGGCV